MEEVRRITTPDAASDVTWRPPDSGEQADHAAAAGPNGFDVFALKAWLRRIEADLHAAWLDCTTTASKDLHESLETALRVMDARLARAVEAGLGTSVEAGLARSQDGLREELSGLISSSLADLDEVISTTRRDWAQGSDDQRAALQALRELTDRLAEQPPPGQAAAEVKAGLETGLATVSDRLVDELTTRSSTLQADMQNSLATVRGEQHELRERLARIEAAIGNLASNLGAQLQRGRQASEERMVSAATSAVKEANKKLGQEVANGRASMVSDLETALSEATKRISEEIVTANSMLLADVELKMSGQLDAAMRHIAERLGSDLDAVRGAMADQARAFEDALMALAKAVSDERRTSAALVKAALATTDETVRGLAQRVDRLAATVDTRRPTRS